MIKNKIIDFSNLQSIEIKRNGDVRDIEIKCDGLVYKFCITDLFNNDSGIYVKAEKTDCGIVNQSAELKFNIKGNVLYRMTGNTILIS